MTHATSRHERIETRHDGHSPDALRWATDAHYEDAVRYDRTYRLRRHDVAFYREMAEEHGSPVLELGVGTGRVAIDLARHGHEVVGVDRMAPMLARLRARLARERAEVRARVTVVRGDIRTFSVPATSSRKRRETRRFPLVIAPFNVFMHLYERRDVERALARVRAHLAPRGAFVLDVRMPDVRSFLREPTRAYRCPRIVDREGTLYDTAEIFQYDAASQVQMITSTYREVAEPHRTFVRPLAHRQFFPRELEALFHYNGFTIEHTWGDFERGPVHLDCESQVLLARARRPRERSR